MKIRFSVDLRKLLDAEAKMALESRLPEFAAKTLDVPMRDRMECNARSKIGNGRFGQELAEGIRSRSDGAEGVIDHVSNDTNHLAQHVHEGASSGRETAGFSHPIDRPVKGEYARLHSWNTADGRPLFIRKQEDGPNGRAYLAESRGKRAKPKFLYVLVRQTKPQKPRPWWPTDEEFTELTERELEWWLKYTLPRTI